jgi:hypothetical protein
MSFRFEDIGAALISFILNIKKDFDYLFFIINFKKAFFLILFFQKQPNLQRKHRKK